MSKIRLGTRGSKLALIQTQMVEDALKAAHPGLDVERVIITTSGDWRPEHGEKSLSEAKGGKGQFIEEIESALQEDVIDCGVHSLKDVPAEMPEGFVISHVLEREDPRDALILHDRKVSGFADIKQNARLGTSSKRRQSVTLRTRPDFSAEIIRGNVDTRLGKLADGQVDATFLAVAGLKRMGLEDKISCALSVDDMVPSAGQGVVALEIRDGDEQTKALLAPLDHKETHQCILAERAALRYFGASCHTPVGVHAHWGDSGEMVIRGYIGSEDGKQAFQEMITENVQTDEEIEALGYRLAYTLCQAAPDTLLAALGIGPKYDLWAPAEGAGGGIEQSA